jgi:hypothetical protein
MNVKCPKCQRINSDIFTHCPYCLFDTAGEAICTSCHRKINQLEYWKNGNSCPYCNSNKTITAKKTKNLFTYYEDFSKNKNEIWKGKFSFFYGRSKLSNHKFIIKNKYGLLWNNWIFLDGLHLSEPFVIKSEIELTSIGNSSIFGLLFGNNICYYRYLFNKDGKFKIEKYLGRNKKNVDIKSSIIKDINEWLEIPNFNLVNHPTILLEVFYNKKYNSLNFYVNGMKIAFCLEDRLPKNRTAIGYSTGKERMEISIKSLFVENYDLNYTY